MKTPKWYFFYDFHTMPACPDVGKNLDAEKLADHWKESGVDYVVFPAKCNLGMAYYNTRIGTRHPSLKFDLLGKLVKACRRRQIAISAYINTGLSHEDALLHREWAVLTKEGYTYGPNRLNYFFRRMCFNTPYGDHLVKMVRELASGYDIAGFFFDGMHREPCIGVECIREMKRRGIDWNDPAALDDFAVATSVKMAKQLTDAAKSVRKNLMLFFNGVHFEDQADFCSHIEFECLPTAPEYGYECLPVYGRYMHTLKKPVFNMTGRFHKSWGDFGGMRAEAGLEYDLLQGLAYGMSCCVGDHLHPRGDFNKPVEEMKKRIFLRLRKLSPWIEGARLSADIGVVVPRLRLIHKIPKAATRLLGELRAQFHILTPQASWEGYRLLILPDNILLDKDAVARIRKHIKQGGKILATACSGLDAGKKDFVMKEWGVRFQGESPFNPAFLLAGPRVSEGMPDMPTTLYERGMAVKALPGTQVLARIGAPFYNRHWDGEHGFAYLPPDRPTKSPAVTLSGRVAYITHPIFSIYHEHAPIPMRRLVANLLDILLPRPMVKTKGLPSFARVIVTDQPHRRIAHVLSYVPEWRGERTQIVEEPIELHDVRLGIRLDGKRPSGIYLAPERKKLEFEITDGYIWVTLPRVPGYAMVIIEKG